jgi:hypothetical protein
MIVFTFSIYVISDTLLIRKISIDSEYFQVINVCFFGGKGSSLW